MLSRTCVHASAYVDAGAADAHGNADCCADGHGVNTLGRDPRQDQVEEQRQRERQVPQVPLVLYNEDIVQGAIALLTRSPQVRRIQAAPGEVVMEACSTLIVVLSGRLALVDRVEGREVGGGEGGGLKLMSVGALECAREVGFLLSPGGGWVGGGGRVGGGERESGALVAEVESCVLALDVEDAEAGMSAPMLALLFHFLALQVCWRV